MGKREGCKDKETNTAEQEGKEVSWKDCERERRRWKVNESKGGKRQRRQTTGKV